MSLSLKSSQNKAMENFLSAVLMTNQMVSTSFSLEYVQIHIST